MRMPRKLVFIALILLLVLATAACQGNSGGSTTYNKAIEVARTEIWANINSGKASSATVAILDGGKIVYSEGFGMAVRETSTPVDTDTLFNIGSTSKTFVAAAVMKLVDDGKVKLDSPVVQYLPDFKMADPRYKDITVRMLLDHQSGLPGTTSANDVGYAVNPDFYEQLLANYTHSHLKADPGFAAPYCNDGFSVAEMLVAKVSGQKYVDYLTSKILQPLGLSRTGVSVGARPDAGIANFYQADTGKKVPPEALAVLGAGGLSSTAGELVLFGDSFSTGGPRALSNSSVAEIIKAQPSKWAQEVVKQAGFNPEEAYGLGLDVVDVPAYQKQGIKVIGKGGDTDVYHSQLLTVPAKRVSVAVIEAGRGSTPGQIAYDVLDSVLEAKGLMKKPATPVTAPVAAQPIPAQYGSFAGFYDMGTALATVSVDLKSNTVAFAVQGSAQPSMLIYNGGSFYLPDGRRFRLISVDGQMVLVQYDHGLGSTFAQKIPAASPPQALGVDINGAVWLRRNVRPYESMDLRSTHIVASTVVPGLTGHVVMSGSKLVESPTFAGMTSKCIRDLTELGLLDRSGQTWIQLSEMLYSPVSVAAPLGSETKPVTIGKDAYNEWLKTTADLVVKFDKPSKDRAIVYGPGGAPTWDSIIDTGEVFAPAGSFIEVSGFPNDVIKVNGTTPTGN